MEVERAFQTAVQLQQRGQPEQAARIYATINQALPRQVDVLRLWGMALLQSGELDGAVERLQQAEAVAPDHPAVLCNLGSAERARNRLESARDYFERALHADPDLPEAHNNLGSMCLLADDLAGAEQHYRRAVALAPGSPAAQANLAATLLRTGQAGEALKAAEAAVAAAPNLLAAQRLRALALAAAGARDAAIESLRELIRRGAGDADLHFHLGVLLDEAGDWDAALTEQRLALEQQPDHGGAVSEALFLKRRLCDWHGLDELGGRFLQLLDTGAAGLKPFTLLSEPSTPAQQQRCARLWARQFITRPRRQHRPAGDRLTIGYLSSGFRRHPTGLLTAPLFEQHAREGFRWVAYAVGPDDGSELRQRIRQGVDQFRDLEGQGHQQMARQIEADGVDILVDLRGYGGGAVTEVMALRPAPLQVNWLAYPGTMGAGFIDYIVLDRHIATVDILEHIDEAPVILPHSYQPCDTTRDWRGRETSRSACGLPAEGVVFCCFNNSYKLSAPVFERWMAILQAVPGSVLWLLEGRAGTALGDNLRREARARGIDPQRLVFMPKLPHLDYLARLALADLFLDTLPYNAHTTAGDALWAGCPVLTASGNTFAGRVATSLVRSAGLPELVTDDLDQYQALAIALASDPDRLRALRQRLQSGRGDAPLFQTRRLATELEQAYRAMAERARAGEPPAPIDIGFPATP